MRNGRLGHADQRRQVAHAQFAMRQRVEDPNARGVPERAEDLGKVDDILVADQGGPQLGYTRGVEVHDLAEILAGVNI